MKTIPKTPLFNPNLYLALAADVSKASSSYACELGDSLKESQASNARNDILDTLSKYRVLAKGAGYRDIVLVLEPTGGYERPLARAAWSLGLDVFYANVEAGEVRVRPVAQVLPKARLAMIYGESGPLEDFASVRQLRKYAGMNARLRQSGTMKGQRRLSKKGRPLFRKLLTQTCLPLVRKGQLFGEEYHRRKASGQPGCKAMVAIANKYLNMLFGVHRSGGAFVAARVAVPLERCLAEAA